MRILIRQGEELIRDEHFQREPITIGSAATARIQLPDQRIASQQVKLYPHAGEAWLIEPLAPGFQTIRNGHILMEATYVEHGDELDLGEFTLRLYPDSEDFDIETTAPRSSAVPAATYDELAKIRSHPLPSGAVIRHGDEAVSLSPADQRAVAQLAFALHSATDVVKLIEAALGFTVRQLGARLAWLGLRRRGYGRLEFVEGRGAGGPSNAEPPLFETISYRCLERGQLIMVPKPPAEHAADIGSLLAIPVQSRLGTLGLIYVDSAPDAPRLGTAAMDMLLMIAAVTAVHWEAIIERQLKTHEALVAGELSFIRQVQARLDPTTVPQVEGFQMAAYCRHGRQRAGDVYDVMKLPNGMIALIVAHADATSTKAALAITEVRTAFRVAGLHADPPHVLLRELNWLLHDPRDPCVLGCFSIIINPRTGVCQYSAAGHIGAVIVELSGEARRLTDADIPAVGVATGQCFESTIGRLNPGETLALFTSGCLTLQNEAGDALGETRFLESLCDGFGQPASAMLDGIQMDLSEFFNSGRQPDDSTVLILHRREG